MQAYRHELPGELRAFKVGAGEVTFEFDAGVQRWLHNNMTVVEMRQQFS